MAKSLFVTYFFWFIGGWLGLHHFYLGRDAHAFLTWSTFGGFFGLGLVLDLFKIPGYVNDANEDARYMAKLALQKQQNDKPPYNLHRHFGQIVAGTMWGSALKLSIPQENGQLHWIEYLVPFAIALGVYTAGNIGHVKGSFTWSLLGASLVLGFIEIGLIQVALSSFASSCLFSPKWRKKPARRTRRSFVRRLNYLGLAAAIYASLWCSFVYFNVQVTDSNGESIQFPVNELKQVLRQTMFHFFQDCFPSASGGLILDEEGQALKVLGLSKDATQEDISSQRRKLARQWHPDLYTDYRKKLKAEAKFAEINESYNKLKKYRRRRVNRSVELDEES